MSKFRNKKEWGFDSKKERLRYQELLILERAGKIQGLTCQVRFELIPAQYQNGKCIERPCAYVADFTYWKDNQFIVEDVKGYKTPDYIIKRKLMLFLRNIRIKET